MYPAHEAKVLVALAAIGGTPANNRAGKVMKLPPPAMELNTPPITPDKNRINQSIVFESNALNDELPYLILLLISGICVFQESDCEFATILELRFFEIAATKKGA